MVGNASTILTRRQGKVIGGSSSLSVKSLPLYFAPAREEMSEGQEGVDRVGESGQSGREWERVDRVEGVGRC